MKNFAERLKPDTKVNYSPSLIPTIEITSTAIDKMRVFVDECADEIGWLGTATYDKASHQYTIHDVYLFKQQVHATTTEIKPEGLTEFATELLAREDGVEIWNNLKVWGHSHVRMGLTPSGQDNKQMEEFSNIGHDWFIRIIANKLGELCVDLFHYEMGITLLNVPWNLDDAGSEEADAIQAEIFRLQKEHEAHLKALEEALETKRNESVDAIKEDVKAEMKDKVSKISYSYTGGTNNASTYRKATTFGRWVNNTWKAWSLYPPTIAEAREHHLLIPKYILDEVEFDEVDLKKNELTDVGDVVGDEEDILDSRTDVYSYFSRGDLVGLSYTVSIDDMIEIVETEHGYAQTFSRNDYDIIWGEVQNIVDEETYFGFRGNGIYDL